MSLVVCWKVWDVRNSEVHGETRGFPPDVVSWAKEFLDCYVQAQQPSSLHSSPALPEIWQPPVGDSIKVKKNIKVIVDVTLPGRRDFLVVSLVARDSSGNYICWKRKTMNGRSPLSDGEAMAVLFGVQEAQNHGWRHVVIETDCYPIYVYLAKGHQSLVSFGALLDSCFKMSSSFSLLLFSFTKRSGNSIAHAIATATDYFVARELLFLLSLLIDLRFGFGFKKQRNLVLVNEK